jgi:hypothetical protein
MLNRSQTVSWIVAAAIMISLTACAADGGPGTTSGGTTGGSAITATSEPLSSGSAGTPTDDMSSTTSGGATGGGAITATSESLSSGSTGTPTDGMISTTSEASSEALASMVINNYGYLDICAVYISPSDSTAWGENLLHGDVLSAYGSYTLDDLPAHMTDFRVSDCYGNEIRTMLGYPVDSGEVVTWNVVVPMPEPTCGGGTGGAGGGSILDTYIWEQCQYFGPGPDESAICILNLTGSDLCHIWLSSDEMSVEDRLQTTVLAIDVFAIEDLLPGLYHVSAEDCGGGEVDTADILVKEDTVHLWIAGE